MIRFFTRILRHWAELHSAARWYLVHIALLTASLAIPELLFNFAVLSFGYNRVELGRLNLVAVWASVLLSLPLWWLVTRIGLRTALLLHTCLQALTIAAYALAPSFTVLVAASAVGGGASVLFQVSAAPLMMRYSDGETRDYLFATNSALAIGVGGLASLVAGALPAIFGFVFRVGAETSGAYRASLLVAAFGLLAALVPLLRLPHAAAPATVVQPIKQARSNPIWSLLQQPWPVLGLLVVPALVSVGAALLVPYLNLFFRQRFGLADTTIGLIFALLSGATAVAILLGPLLSSRFGKKWTIAFAQAISIPFLLLMGFAPFLGIAVIAAVVRGSLFNLARPLYDAFAMERTDERMRPTVIGLIGGASTVGYLFAPEISTHIQERYGFGPLFGITAACYALATIAFAAIYLRPRA